MRIKHIGPIVLMALAINASAIEIQVTPWSAPNGYGSPSFDGAVSNQIYALRNGLTAYGNPALPTYYQAAPAVMDVRDNIVTGFPSWKGDADPVGTYGAAFGSEFGNRLHFGIDIRGQESKIAIVNLAFTAFSTDLGNSLGFSYIVGSYNYSSQYMGWDYGLDGVRGTGDDIFITGGPNSRLVDEIVGRGSGNAWDVYDTSAPLLGTRQEKIDFAVSQIKGDGTPFDFVGTYTMGDVNGSGKVTFGTVPGPASVPDTGSTLALLGGALMGLAAIRRKLSA